jgi:hypothetical protein
MRRLMIFLLLLMMASMACGLPAESLPTVTPTPGVDPVAAGVQLIQQDMILRITEQAIEAQRIETGAKLTATQQVLDATATALRHDENVQQTEVAAASTKSVWQVTVAAGKSYDAATAQAQETATAQAFVQATSTAAAQATGTQAAVFGITATVAAEAMKTSDFKTQQAPFVEAKMTAVRAQAESAELAASRERMTNGFIAWGPWFIALVAVAAFVFVLIRKSQVGTVERDANGMMPGVVLFHNGQKQFIVPDRMFSPVLTLDSHGISAPQLADPERQEGATRRAQAVEAINALPPQTQRQGMGLMAQTFNTATRPTIEVMESGQVAGWVDEAETKLGEEL